MSLRLNSKMSFTQSTSTHQARLWYQLYLQVWIRPWLDSQSLLMHQPPKSQTLLMPLNNLAFHLLGSVHLTSDQSVMVKLARHSPLVLLISPMLVVLITSHIKSKFKYHGLELLELSRPTMLPKVSYSIMSRTLPSPFSTILQWPPLLIPHHSKSTSTIMIRLMLEILILYGQSYLTLLCPSTITILNWTLF